MRRPVWVVMTYAILLILGVSMAIPNFLSSETRAGLPRFLTQNTVPLGLDLQGGAHLLLAVDRPALKAAQVQALRESVADLGEGPVREAGGVVSAPAAVEDALAALVREGALPEVDVARAGERVEISLTEAALDRAAGEAAAASVEVIRHRIDQVGVAEPLIRRVGGDRILVQLPGTDNPGQLRELLGSTASMSFHLVPDGEERPGASLLPLRDGGGMVLVEDRTALSGEHLERATVGFDDQTGRPVVNFRFDRSGAVAFGEITAENVGRQFAVVLDGEVLTAPVIQQVIAGGQGQISGQFTVEEAQTLSVLLSSGALPASLSVIEERSVGAALGSDSIRAGIISGGVGLALVVAMMAGLYGGWGVLASGALALNVMLTLAALGLIGATLTLPGIAGIILCLGIAVDANILIFSRIREETARGAAGIKALTLGFDRAWATIWDANITTLLAMGILFIFGAGAIRGFAVTMGLGIVISMFTAIVLMRMVMEYLVRRRRMARLEIAPLIGRVPVPGAWSFMRYSGLAIAVSAVLSVGSVGMLAAPGLSLGIDFTGGVQMVVQADEPVPMAELRTGLAGLGLGDVALQEFGGPQEALIRVQGDAGQATVAAIEAAVQQVMPEARFAQIDLVGPAISGELAQTGMVALGLAVLGMLAYIWVRFEWQFAVGAIAVLALDVTKTLGVIALMGWEVNLTTIVALLTLIGYSVNDKVVVYDRMRETMRVPGRRTFRELIDRSINQVLARCVFTSATTLVALVPMAVWGGPAVAGFALPMIAGVVIATASSVFIAGPLLVWLGGQGVPARA